MHSTTKSVRFESSEVTSGASSAGASSSGCAGVAAVRATSRSSLPCSSYSQQQQEQPPPPPECHRGGSASRTTSSTELWFREEERWELTWPIWQMLPREERKALALKHGYKTIGEFEEYMTLQRGLTDSTQNPYENALAYPPANSNNRSTPSKQQQQQCDGPDSKVVITRMKTKKRLEEDDDVDVSDSDEKLEAALDAEERNAADLNATTTTTMDLRKVGGWIVVLLPEELLHRVFDYLPVDAYATLALVSPHWKFVTRTEHVYKRLCERLYLNQCAKAKKRQLLHVGRFVNSYRTMLEKRPRVRAGGGVYVMKFTKIKPIQRDMWTEIPVGAVLEMVYYRYIYFQEDGRVLYALTSSPPHEMFRRFQKVCLDQVHAADKCIVEGSYTVQKTQVQVHAKQEWQHVRLDLTIQPEYQYHGRWGYLSFDRHMSSASNNFEDWSPDRVNYEVPEEPFRFVRDKRL